MRLCILFCSNLYFKWPYSGVNSHPDGTTGADIECRPVNKGINSSEKPTVKASLCVITVEYHFITCKEYSESEKECFKCFQAI